MCGDIIRNVKIFYRNRRYDEALRYHRIIHNNYRKFVLLVLVSTIPTGIIGVMGKDLISFASTTLIVPGVCLLLTGLLLLVADHCKDGKKIPKDISYSKMCIRDSSLVAAAIHADIYENWTDVSGFLVTDPRIVVNPEVIETITYRELRELSYMGATVLHEEAIFPVRKEGIPINIRNTNAPEDKGDVYKRQPE